MSDTHWHISAKRSVQYDIIKHNDVFNDTSKLVFSQNFVLKTTKNNKIRRFVVIDNNVRKLYGSKIEHFFTKNNVSVKYYEFFSGEENKNFSSYFKILQALEKFGITRRSEPIIAIGGGVLTDVVGFVASTYRRGIPHIHVPTTLMGYVDASIGIKCGLNDQSLKNRIGSFYPPQKVILDKTFLQSLSYRHIRNGVGEILKLGIIKDSHLFELLETYGKHCIENKFQSFSKEYIDKHNLHTYPLYTLLQYNLQNNDIAQYILDRSINSILEELEPNLFEDNLERSVDFGHTFSTSIEMLPNKDIYHGEAVTLDIYISCILAYNRHILCEKDFSRIISLMQSLQLNSNFHGITSKLLWESVIERTEHRNGYQRIPLPSGIGTCSFINDISQEEINTVVAYIKKNLLYSNKKS